MEPLDSSDYSSATEESEGGYEFVQRRRVKPNSHRRRRRGETVEFSLVGGVK